MTAATAPKLTTASDASTVAVAAALARRSIISITRVPAAIVPTVAMPVFFVIAFSGSFNGLTELRQFPTDRILNWTMPFAICQGAAFAGLGAAFGTARDLEGGFYDRLLLSPAPRRALLVGPLVSSMVRALLPVVVVFTIATLGGARLTDGPLGFASLVLAAEGVAVLAALWGLGVVYRLKTQRSMALVQVGIFVTMFLTAGQVPLTAMTGWLHAVARVNPMTNILRLARQGFLGDVSWAATWPALVVFAGGAMLLGAFAVRGLRRLVP